jgi:phage gpG-like protein
MSIEIRVQGLQEAEKYIKQVLSSVKDRTRMMRQIGTAVNKWIDTNFAAEGIEQHWHRLATSTVFARTQGRGGGSAKILQDNGLLRASHSFVATADRVVVGFPEGSTAAYHHFGTNPYVIRPRSANVLAFPFPMWMNPGRRVGGANVIVRRRAGTSRGGIVSAKRAKQLGHTVPNGKGDIQAMLMTRKVNHPGLAARKLLPSIALAEQIAQQAASEYVQTVVDKLGTP